MPKPEWLKVSLLNTASAGATNKALAGINTICRSAKCPNISECYNRGTATFLILGDICTRRCRFCAVTKGTPSAPDKNEPQRIADAVVRLNLKYVVITSVTRDDLPDGGAEAFARTVREIKRAVPVCKIEILIPDLMGDLSSLKTIAESGPEVIAHNMETVERLYGSVRTGADYKRSLKLLEDIKSVSKAIKTKSGVLLGLGEQDNEVTELMREVRGAGCDLFTLGQYLQPRRDNLPVDRYLSPAEFNRFKEEALAIGFMHIEAGPLVRSSYHAEEAVLEDK